LLILGRCHGAEVGATIVEFVAVDVVDFRVMSGCQSKDHAMQSYADYPPVNALAPDGVSRVIEAPAPLTHHRKVIMVN
jgi:hypothetical protein